MLNSIEREHKACCSRQSLAPIICDSALNVKNMAQGKSDGLVFITYTNAQHGGKINDPQTRRKVRKQAWNAWWSQEADRRLKSRSTRPLKQSQGRFRIRNEPLVIESATPLERALLASPSPFQAVVETIGDQAWDLLNYCKLPGYRELRQC